METPETSGKQAVRARLLDHRRTLSTVDRTGAAQRLRGTLGMVLRDLVAPGGTVAAYVPMPGEPGGADLPEFLTGAGYEVLLPVLRADMGLDWVAFTGELVPGNIRGLREPVGPLTDVARADVLLVPALAVGKDGTRLGRGGGSYDRALSHVPGSVPVIALLHDGEFLAEVPGEAHDRAVTGVITPRGGYARIG